MLKRCRAEKEVIVDVTKHTLQLQISCSLLVHSKHRDVNEVQDKKYEVMQLNANGCQPTDQPTDRPTKQSTAAND
jgi:hypothetical protein